MIFLATGTPTAKIEGDQIAVTIPSGKDSIIIALTYGQARHFAETTIRTVNAAIAAANREAAPTAELIALPKCLPSLARRERKVADVIRAYPDAFTSAGKADR